MSNKTFSYKATFYSFLIFLLLMLYLVIFSSCKIYVKRPLEFKYEFYYNSNDSVIGYCIVDSHRIFQYTYAAKDAWDRKMLSDNYIYLGKGYKYHRSNKDITTK